MNIWATARNEGRKSSQQVRIETGDKYQEKLFAYPGSKEKWANQECLFCNAKGNLRVGLLKLSGKLVFCEEHRARYHEQKSYESQGEKLES